MEDVATPAEPSKNPLRRMYAWVLSWADSRWGWLALFVLSFCESSWFPIPPDPLLMALALGKRRHALVFAGLCTLASVLGGGFGYWIGATAFDSVGQPILEAYGKTGSFEELATKFRAEGELAVLIAALTPVPYKLVTIASGVVNMNLPAFLGASIVGRGARFFLVAGLIWWKGETIAAFIERWFEVLTVVFAVLLVGGFLAIKTLH